MSFRVVIPARFASSRLPGKPLADLGGKPMVVRVAEAARRSSADEVWIATDDQRIADVVRQHGHDAVMTRVDHPSGTDRIAEVIGLLGWAADAVVVNLQGDEPLVDPSLLERVAGALVEDPEASVATACHPLTSVHEFFNPNVVKVVLDRNGRALYFSRAPIPWARDAFALDRESMPTDFVARRHIGIYAYRGEFLLRYRELPASPLERVESLEQLRALWHGAAIKVVEVAGAPAPGIDTPEDLEQARRMFDGAADSA